MKSRLEFHSELEQLLGSQYVYFQPPESLKMYPGNRIVYSRGEPKTQDADNTEYVNHAKYSVMLISKDPDWELVTRFKRNFKHCRHDRHYVADNLNHDVFIIYY